MNAQTPGLTTEEVLDLLLQTIISESACAQKLGVDRQEVRRMAEARKKERCKLTLTVELIFDEPVWQVVDVAEKVFDALKRTADEVGFFPEDNVPDGLQGEAPIDEFEGCTTGLAVAIGDFWLVNNWSRR